jgi:hypothetical protein
LIGKPQRGSDWNGKTSNSSCYIGIGIILTNVSKRFLFIQVTQFYRAN